MLLENRRANTVDRARAALVNRPRHVEVQQHHEKICVFYALNCYFGRRLDFAEFNARLEAVGVIRDQSRERAVVMHHLDTALRSGFPDGRSRRLVYVGGVVANQAQRDHARRECRIVKSIARSKRLFEISDDLTYQKVASIANEAGAQRYFAYYWHRNPDTGGRDGGHAVCMRKSREVEGAWDYMSSATPPVTERIPPEPGQHIKDLSDENTPPGRLKVLGFYLLRIIPVADQRAVFPNIWIPDEVSRENFPPFVRR